MVRERGQKKSFQQSLEDIKEKMKEKRNKRLASASAPSRGRSKMINKTSGGNSRHIILKGVQLNNKALAVALQAEKEKVRQANVVILQLKREQQALFLHLLLLKRKLKEQEALSSAAEREPTKITAEPQIQVDSLRTQISQSLNKPIASEAPAVWTDSQVPEKSGQSESDTQVALPRTVGVRRRHAESSRRRRSDRVRERRSLSEGDSVMSLEGVVGDVLQGLGTLTASPILCDSGNQNHTQQQEQPEPADPTGPVEFEHSTPEPAPQKATSQQKPRRKQAQQQPRAKPESTAQKPERGRKPERAPLKKPWENPKPRARSKSRDRSATRARAAPPPQGDKLNTSLGFNDTFDFDCEGTVHLTPFRAKAEDNKLATPICEEASRSGQTSKQSSPVVSKETETSLSSASSSESEDSLYVPQKAWRKQSPPGRTKVIPTRRRRRSEKVEQKENIPLQQEMPGFRDNEASPKSLDPEKEELPVSQSPDCVFANSPDPVSLGQENHLEPCRDDVEEDCLLPVTPGVEAEIMRIDNVLSSFGDSTETPPLLPSQTPKRANTCKRPYRKFSCGGSRPSDARCSTPVPARKRRCTMTVDYKEPSLNAKLRRGDKFTDLQFLRSPIFKQKSSRRSVQNSRKSQQTLEKYNESFVGCR
ncbi:shugoshin 1 isoform X2 [Myripristis murdjan]|uniref:shugoshin 1 isoform X2 n=1 Tax=Myripristis murdjan TaxID=586833 RepID=UPI001175DBCF|nr:shugoshin 1 isoform X2 [Myripristis murdjan]